MIDVCDAVAEVIRPLTELPVVTRRLMELDGPEGVVVRQASSSVVDEYYDGLKILSVVVDVLTRSEREAIAEGLTWTFRDVLDGLPLLSPSESYRWTATEIYTEPQELKLDDADRYDWHVQVAVRIEDRRQR